MIGFCKLVVIEVKISKLFNFLQEATKQNKKFRLIFQHYDIHTHGHSSTTTPSVGINETVSISEDSNKSESEQNQVHIVISYDQDTGTRQLVGYYNFYFFFY